MRRFKGECAHFSLSKCSFYTHDGASAKYSTNSQETDNSAASPGWALLAVIPPAAGGGGQHGWWCLGGGEQVVRQEERHAGVGQAVTVDRPQLEYVGIQDLRSSPQIFLSQNKKVFVLKIRLRIYIRNFAAPNIIFYIITKKSPT